MSTIYTREVSYLIVIPFAGLQAQESPATLAFLIRSLPLPQSFWVDTWEQGCVAV